MRLTQTCVRDNCGGSVRSKDRSCTKCVCPAGHVDPPRYASGSCALCVRKRNQTLTLEERRANYRKYRDRQIFAKTGKTYAEYRRDRARVSELRTMRRHMLNGAKHRAHALGVPFKLRLRDIRIPERCPVLGIELVKGKGASHAGSPSLDRIVPSVGYVPGNVRVISNLANSVKGSVTDPEVFRKVADYVEKETVDFAWL